MGERSSLVEMMAHKAMKDRERLFTAEESQSHSDGGDGPSNGQQATNVQTRKLLLAHEATMNWCAEKYAQGHYEFEQSKQSQAPAIPHARPQHSGASSHPTTLGRTGDLGTSAILNGMTQLQDRMERLADRMTSLETVVHHALHLGFQAPVQMQSPTAEAAPVRKTSKKNERERSLACLLCPHLRLLHPRLPARREQLGRHQWPPATAWRVTTLAGRLQRHPAIARGR